jgi:hypothetical protein
MISIDKFNPIEENFMKSILLSGLSALFIAALPIPSVKAEMVSQQVVYKVEPFTLVYLGYQGYFEREGIPSNGAFISAVEAGKITPIILVQSAIDHGRLAPETLSDREYLNNVATQLKFLELH